MPLTPRPQRAAGDPLAEDAVAAWLDAYGAAWEDRDGEAAARLFSEDAVYHWGPFETLDRRAAIAQRWAAATRDQREIRFEHTPLGTYGEQAFAHWRTTLTRASTADGVELDGIFVLRFGADGKCAELSEWWRDRRL